MIFTVLFCCTPTVFAASVTIHPLVASPGEPIFVQMNGVPDDANMEIVIDSTIATTTQSVFNFTVVDLTSSYYMQPAELVSNITDLSDDKPCNLRIWETDHLGNPGREINSRGHPRNGTYEVNTQQQGIEPQNYQAYFTGTAADDQVNIKLTLQGIVKNGPKIAQNSFMLEGFSDGKTVVSVYMNRILIKSELITIRS